MCRRGERREVYFARVEGMEAGGMGVGAGEGVGVVVWVLGGGGAERVVVLVVEGEVVEMGGRAAEGGRAERSPSIWLGGLAGCRGGRLAGDL